MQERAAHEVADKVRRQLTGIDGVAAVDPVQWAPDPEGGGWVVRVARMPARGGPLHIIGNDHDGYRIAENGNSAPRSLPALVRDVFLGAPEDEQVAQDDAELGALIRGYAATLKYVGERLSQRARDLETRRRHLPWVVLDPSGDSPVVRGPYLNEEAAKAAATRVGGIALQAQPEEA